MTDTNCPNTVPTVVLEWMVTKMADYIEREAVKRLINIDYGGYLDAIDRIPAADVAQVVHGRWTAQCVVELDGGWTFEDVPYNAYQHSNPICSVCRKTALIDGGEDYVTSPYCPNCGARMNGGKNDD